MNATEPAVQAAPSTTDPLAPPALAEGETYVGAILSADGARRHHLILLPGEAEGLTWKKAKAWAAERGGELPDRVESALLFAHLKTEFQPDWYWTREQRAAVSVCAWSQHFGYGFQDYDNASYQLRARAVRRSVIQ